MIIKVYHRIYNLDVNIIEVWFLVIGISYVPILFRIDYDTRIINY